VTAIAFGPDAGSGAVDRVCRQVPAGGQSKRTGDGRQRDVDARSGQSGVETTSPTTFEFKVRRGGFSVLKDGKPFLQWQGSSSRP